MTRYAAYLAGETTVLPALDEWILRLDGGRARNAYLSALSPGIGEAAWGADIAITTPSSDDGGGFVDIGPSAAADLASHGRY